jgi:hypothetical protein
MLCCRIIAGGLALLAASVVNASAQSCLPWACQESRSSARAADATSPQNVKHLPLPRPDQRRLSAAGSHQRLARRDVSQRDEMLDQEKKEPSLKELRRQENQSSTPTEQAARDALFDEFLRWQVHQVLGE